MAELLDLFGTASKSVRAATDLELRRHGLRLGHDHLLAQLWRNDGLTPGQIAKAVRVSTPAVTKTATVLGNAGLLVRRPDERDSRLVRLWLTDAGRALQEPVESSRELVEQRLAAALTPTEHRHLIAALAKIANAAAGNSVQDR